MAKGCSGNLKQSLIVIQETKSSVDAHLGMLTYVYFSKSRTHNSISHSDSWSVGLSVGPSDGRS